MKKLIALSLAALMLLFALVSCSGNQTDGPADGPDDTVIETVRETNKWHEDQIDLGLPEELDYQGVEIGIACRPETRYRREISVEKQEDPLDMQIAIRNQWVQHFLNVKMKFIESPEMWVAADIENFVKTESEAGSLSSVDVIFAYAAYSTTPSMRPYIVNLNGDKLPYMNINKAYWNQSFVEKATCYDQLYYIVGDLTLTIYDKAMVTFVNLDDAADAGITADSLYDSVYNNEWTFEKYANIATNYPYLDNNNNRTVDAGDQIRVSTVKGSEQLDGYYAAFNLSLLKENDDKTHTVTVDGNETLKNGAAMVRDLYNSQGIFLGDTEAIQRFYAGDSLFHVDILYRNAAQNQQLRNVDFNYAILPLPMYSTDQGAYYTTPQDAHNLISVLKIHPEKYEAISAFLEAMTSKSYDEIRPFYIEKMVKGEYAADADSVKMVDIIMDGITFDTPVLYSIDTAGRYALSLWRSCAAGNGKDVDTKWAEIQETVTTATRMFDMWFQGTQAIA